MGEIEPATLAVMNPMLESKFRLSRVCVPLVLGTLLVSSGCCRTLQSDPPQPTSIKGWSEFDRNGIRVIGEFLLRKGQPMENDDLGIELVKTIAFQECSDPGAENDPFPGAFLRFYSVPSKKTLVEVEIRKSTSASIHSISKRQVNAIFAREINTKDPWVWIELWH